MKKALSLVLFGMILSVMLLSVYPVSAGATEYYKGTNCTEQPATGSVLVGNNGYFSSTTYTKFSEGEEATITITLDEVGSDWSTNGFALVVNSELVSSLTFEECSDGKDGLFAFMYHVSNSQLLGQKYSWGSGSSDTRWAGWEQPTLSGDVPTITFTVKVVDGVIHIVRGGKTWKFNNSGSYNTMTLSDGYIGIVTAANAKVTVQNVGLPIEAPFTGGSAGILTTLVNDKQGLRFNHTLTTTKVDGEETVTIRGTVYTVSKIGMAVSKNPDADMTVGSAGVMSGYLTSARSVTVDGDNTTYDFSILVKNISSANKATDIYARPYLECADGTVIYGKVQVTNVQEMYNALKASTDFSDDIDEWMAIDLYKDGDFEQGLNVISVDGTNGQVFNFGDADRTGVSSWNMTQHFSKYDLITATPVVNADGSVSYENDGKRVTLSQENGENVLQMEMFGNNEYDSPRQSGEDWPHLLIEQNLNSDTLDSYDKMTFSMTIRKDYITDYMGDDFDWGLHCYQTGMIFIVQNMNTASAGYGEEYFWFSVPGFDSRMEYKGVGSKADDGKDDASGQWIYEMGGEEFFNAYYTANPMTNDGQWCTVTLDILPYLQDAFQQAKDNGYMSNTNFEDLRLQGINFGAECTGTYDASVSIKNVSLLCVTY